MNFTLGLDVSTSCTGWAVFDADDHFVDMDSIVLSKSPTLYTKATMVRHVLNELFIKYPIGKVYIEENLQSFRRGFSSAKTLSTLARFNGVVSLVSYETFSVEPMHINVNAARKSLGIKLIRKKQGGAPTKQQIFEWVDADLRAGEVIHPWPIKVLKSGPRKGTELLDPMSYDMADAYVIARAGLIADVIA